MSTYDFVGLRYSAVGMIGTLSYFYISAINYSSKFKKCPLHHLKKKKSYDNCNIDKKQFGKINVYTI